MINDIEAIANLLRSKQLSNYKVAALISTPEQFTAAVKLLFDELREADGFKDVANYILLPDENSSIYLHITVFNSKIKHIFIAEEKERQPHSNAIKYGITYVCDSLGDAALYFKQIMSK